MTPEERLDRIEKLLATTAEQQARQQEEHGREIDKQNEAIRGLIVVGRTCLDSIQEMRVRHDKDHERMLTEIDKLREAQAATDEKLNILIDTVDRIIRHRDGTDK